MQWSSSAIGRLIDDPDEGRTVVIVSVMQPTFLPWLGYFDLLDQADVFVLLDTVQLERQSWQQRNRVKTATGVSWLTVPVQHDGLQQRIVGTRIQPAQPWRRKHFETLHHAYRHAAYWHELSGGLHETYARDWTLLGELNEHFIRLLAEGFGIDLVHSRSAGPKLVRASDLGITGRRSELLINLCRHLGAHTYLSTPGSAAYLATDNPFPEAGIELRYQVYAHPTYRQLHNGFVSHLSALDLLLNEGPAASEVLRSGRRPSSPLPPALNAHEPPADS